MFSIYKITNKINGKLYIGYSCRPNNRWYDHKKYALSGRKGILNDAIRKYQSNNFNFEIIYQSLDKIHTHKIMEDYFIEEYKSRAPNGYNNAPGGQGGALFLGFKHTMETKEKISKARMGTFASKETKEKISFSLSGKLNPMYGKRHSEVTKQKIRDKALGRPSKQKGKVFPSNINNPTAKKYLIQLPDGSQVIIKNLSHFCRENNLTSTEMNKTFTGKARQHKGYRVIERL
jgi:group I intron endonuclease